MSTLNVNNISPESGTKISLGGTSIGLPSSATAPSSPSAGDMYFNTTTQKVNVYDATESDWTTLDSYVPYNISYLVVAGGGSGGAHGGSGAGAGGYRNSYASETSGGGSVTETPLISVSGRVYTITVGAGGSGVVNANGTDGGVSSIVSVGDSITSVGGAKGRSAVAGAGVGFSGGSGSGGAGATTTFAGGSGTTGQGSAGGSTQSSFNTGGGGGSGAVGGDGSSGTNTAGSGGSGTLSSITGSSVGRAGGGGGSSQTGTAGSGGAYGGGAGSVSGNGVSGTVNTGSGGGGTHHSSTTSGSGGSGVVILRMPTSRYTGVYSGSPSVTTSGVDTILVFNSSGSYTG